MHSYERPIFIVSAPRSGSTLLRLILDAHPNIAIPGPAWLYEFVRPFLYSYGDLTLQSNLLALAEDILETPTIKMWSVDLTAAELLAAAESPGFAGLYNALHKQYAESGGKGRWGEKSPRNCFWMDEIRQDFPDAVFIHLVRDGRDMAVDIAQSSAMIPSNPYSGAHIWRDYNLAALKSAQHLDETSYYRIHYEKICSDPEKELKALCGFLGEDFDPIMLKHHESPSAKSWSRHTNHAKTGRPVSTDYCGLYLNKLRARDRSALNYVIGDLLQQFGYPVEDEALALNERLAWQLLEVDSLTAPWAITYRQWHEERRKTRRAAGIWRDADRDSLLRAIN